VGDTYSVGSDDLDEHFLTDYAKSVFLTPHLRMERYQIYERCVFYNIRRRTKTQNSVILDAEYHSQNPLESGLFFRLSADLVSHVTHIFS
jgi:hypothetical protein